jgi:hypothetical protein
MSHLSSRPWRPPATSKLKEKVLKKRWSSYFPYQYQLIPGEHEKALPHVTSFPMASEAACSLETEGEGVAVIL